MEYGSDSKPESDESNESGSENENGSSSEVESDNLSESSDEDDDVEDIPLVYTSMAAASLKDSVPSRSEPREKGNQRWRERTATYEANVSRLRESASRCSTMKSSFGSHSSAEPKCFFCEESAITVCHDCTRSGRYACEDHCCMNMSESIIHNVSIKDDGGGLKPRSIPLRTWSSENCFYCSCSFRSKPATTSSSYSVVVHTAYSGVVDIDVRTQCCSECSYVSGEMAGEFNCTPGSDKIWFTDELMDFIRRIYVANGFNISTYAFFKAKVDADAARESFGGTRSASYQAFTAALRVYRVVQNDIRALSLRGGNRPPVEGLEFCPACADGIHSLNFDACMKIVCALFNSESQAPPLKQYDDMLGPFTLVQRKLLDELMEKFRVCRKERVESLARAGKKGSGGSTPSQDIAGGCSSNYRASEAASVNSDSTNARKMAISGLFGAVCNHGSVLKETFRMITTGGERLELTQLGLEYIFHLCGLLPNTKVFGPVPAGNTCRPPKFAIYDLTCKLIQRLKNELGWSFEHIQFALGKMHGMSCVVLLAYAFHSFDFVRPNFLM